MSTVVTPSTIQPTRVQLFTTSAEALTAHPRINRSAPLALRAFRAITGTYMFVAADRVTCQLDITGEGGMCNEVHGRGWIMKRADGVECFIGGDCAGVFRCRPCLQT